MTPAKSATAAATRMTKAERRGNELIHAGRDADQDVHAIDDLEDDVVQILEGSSQYFNSWIFSQKKIPYFEFQSYMNKLAQSEQGNLSIKYLRKGEVHWVAHIDQAAEFIREPPVLLRKLIAFHAVMPKDKPQTCQW